MPELIAHGFVLDVCDPSSGSVGLPDCLRSCHDTTGMSERRAAGFGYM